MRKCEHGTGDGYDDGEDDLEYLIAGGIRIDALPGLQQPLELGSVLIVRDLVHAALPLIR